MYMHHKNTSFSCGKNQRAIDRRTFQIMKYEQYVLIQKGIDGNRVRMRFVLS